MKPCRRLIAEALLGSPLDTLGFGVCPGRAKHTSQDAPRDFQVYLLNGVPTAHCFHAHCAAEVERYSRQLRQAIGRLERGYPVPTTILATSRLATPKLPKLTKCPPLDLARLRDFAAPAPEVDEHWLRRRSPLDPDRTDSGQFLDALYRPDERILIFTRQTSQGDFGWRVGRGGFRLEPRRQVKASPSPLPTGGADGVWFLVQPVSGRWEINARMTVAGQPPRWTRRSGENVTAWRYFVLENDEAPAGLWLRMLARLPLPIAAIYTSGGRSIHALVRRDVGSKAQWDAVRDVLRQGLCPLGADGAALTAVRLSRLPGCQRAGRQQRLLYLDPQADHNPLLSRTELRHQ